MTEKLNLSSTNTLVTPQLGEYFNWEEVKKQGAGEIADRLRHTDEVNSRKTSKEETEHVESIEESTEGTIEDDNEDWDWKEIEAEIGELTVEDEEIEEVIERSEQRGPKPYIKQPPLAEHHTIMYRQITELKKSFNLTSTVLNLDGYRIQNKIMIACMYESAIKSKKKNNGYGSLLTTNPILSSHFGVTLTSVHKFLKRLEADRIIKIARYICPREEHLKRASRVCYVSPLDYGCENSHEVPKEIVFIKDLSYHRPEKKKYIKSSTSQDNTAYDSTSEFYFKVNYENLKKWKKIIGMQPIILYFFLCNKAKQDKSAVHEATSRTIKISASWIALKMGIRRAHVSSYMNILKRHGLLEKKTSDTITVYHPNCFKE